ncbi:MAG: SH3 domain-containing protein [Clostridia bacterium]|nr:SH3 domain-containing protein [Clostridia bacterium]
MRKLIAVILAAALCLSLSSCRMHSPVYIDNREYDTGEYIKTSDGVSLEMLNADYWIDDGDNKAVMNSAEIKEFNDANNKLISSGSGGNISLREVGDETGGVMVRELINSIPVPSYADEAYINGERVGPDYWEKLIEETNVDAIGEKVKVRFGFSTVRATLRLFPTNDYANNESDDLFYDGLIMSDYMPFSPLAVLHESKNKEWFFVSMYGYSGWIEKTKVALCESRADWLRRQDISDFLIVTGKELRLTDDPYATGLSGQLLPMGTKLPLVKIDEAPEIIRQRGLYGNYIVKLPIRQSNGIISDEYMLVPVNSDVSTGYLPYTRANVIRLAFKLLGDIYGWAGSFHSNDCSGIIREIFLCFGMEFPRVANQQMKVSGLKYTDLAEMNDSEKIELLSDTPAGSFLYMSGHIMIYLGMDEGEPYVISSVGSISTAETNSGEFEQVNSVIVSSLLRTKRKTGTIWLTNISSLLVVEKEEK